MPLRYPRFPSAEPWFYPPASGPSNPDPSVLTDDAGSRALDSGPADLGELVATKPRGPALAHSPCLAAPAGGSWFPGEPSRATSVSEDA
jgi:hypothetical protein